ncbi:MAG: hypothetical protein CVT89_03640 [Candidatus Altiarchaeales archaeon HGW-Altiarchaeales-2]|nr:MAG: hypothetical protein CVT89_03640 [Candidatus Altiarchaeales archaeon HGW-Altiarchaeales-2]
MINSERIKKLKKGYTDNIFSVKDVSKYMEISKRSAYSLMKKLMESNEVVKIAKSTYKFSNLRTKPRLNPRLEKVRKILNKTSFFFHSKLSKNARFTE